MFVNHPNHVLGVKYGASKAEIKRAYKEIALSCHPDKLGNLDDEDEKNRRIEKFKEATKAYEMLMKDMNDMCDMCDNSDYYESSYTYDADEWSDSMDWKDMWYKFFNNNQDTKEIIKETLVDIANSFIKSKIYPKSYYNPQTSTSNLEVQKRHEISLEVSYSEILMNSKKKLRLILVDIEDPIFIDIYCGAFPQIVKEYTDDNDVEHEIIINLEIKKQDEWDHIIAKSGTVDIVTSVDILWKEYILGCEKKIDYIDGRHLIIYVPPFHNDYVEVERKGLKGGSLIVKLCLKNVNRETWMNLPEKDKVDMIRILDTLSQNT